MRAIEQCRTAALGGQVYSCPDCEGVTAYSYHSCRNRHCPKCQAENAQVWLEQQIALQLPVPYFLLTFTLPASFRDVARSHQKLIYDQLFRTSAAATQALANDPRYVGGQIGLVGVLQTWGRNLAYHPHVHYLVPAGGLGADGQTWHPARANFLVPVKALSKIFRAKLRAALQKTAAVYQLIPAKAWKQAWVVHCEPVGSGVEALKYLAPYIFRVALSNNRLLKMEAGQVTFRYQDTDSGKEKWCTLAAEEFTRSGRFLQHVLPKGFVKVRYYGLFSPGKRKALTALRHHLGPLPPAPPAPPAPPPPPSGADEAATPTGPLAAAQTPRCPRCGRPMQPGQHLPATGRAPP
jgi:hypothetical protein